MAPVENMSMNDKANSTVNDSINSYLNEETQDNIMLTRET